MISCHISNRHKDDFHAQTRTAVKGVRGDHEDFAARPRAQAAKLRAEASPLEAEKGGIYGEGGADGI
jgi:hypothetical protein